MRIWAAILLTLWIHSAAAAQGAGSEDFRVDTQIFVDPDEPPVSEVRTLFTQAPTGEVIYDFLLDQQRAVRETTVLDVARGRVLLLSPPRQLATELQVDKVFELAVAIRNRAPQGQGPLFNPEFAASRQGETLTMAGQAMTYEVQLAAPKFRSAAGRYELFATWAARLNSLRPPNPPSSGREKVNHEVAAAGKVPGSVRRTIRHRGRKVEVLSKHAYIWALGGGDRQLIRATHNQQATFRKVSVEAYFEIKPTPAEQAAR